MQKIIVNAKKFHFPVPDELRQALDAPDNVHECFTECMKQLEYLSALPSQIKDRISAEGGLDIFAMFCFNYPQAYQASWEQGLSWWIPSPRNPEKWEMVDEVTYLAFTRGEAPPPDSLPPKAELDRAVHRPGTYPEQLRELVKRLSLLPRGWTPRSSRERDSFLWGLGEAFPALSSPPASTISSIFDMFLVERAEGGTLQHIRSKGEDFFQAKAGAEFYGKVREAFPAPETFHLPPCPVCSGSGKNPFDSTGDCSLCHLCKGTGQDPYPKHELGEELPK